MMNKLFPGLAFASFIVVALILSGCTAGSKAALQTGIAGIQDGADTVAQTLIVSTCGMTVGAYKRLDNPNHQRGVDLLCGGNGEEPVTKQDLRDWRVLETP